MNTTMVLRIFYAVFSIYLLLFCTLIIIVVPFFYFRGDVFGLGTGYIGSLHSI